jgi:hypothetical protein
MNNDEHNVFGIDKFNLDKEWISQPKLVFNFAQQLAQAKRELEERKAQYDVIKADVEMNIRKDPEKYGLAKVTESAISSTVCMQDEYKQANQAIIKAKYDVDICQGAMNAMEHKKAGLQDLVKLHGQNYYSTTHASFENTSDVEEATKQIVRRKKIRREKE